MSGRDLIQEMRESGKAPRARSSMGAFDWALGFIIVAAIGAIAYFGVTHWLTPGTPPRAPAPVVAAIAPASANVTAAAWTDADTARCLNRARAAASAKLPADFVFANRAVTEGFAGLATRLQCHLTTKIKRFCDPEQKAAIVAMVNDYLGRSDLVQLGLGVQGAPMALLGGTMGGEIAAGSSIYNEQKDQTLKFMASYHKGITVALQTLARDGLVAPGDFAGVFGGVPKTVETMFGSVKPQRNLCA